MNNNHQQRSFGHRHLSLTAMALLLAGLLSACSSGLTVRSEIDPTADFSQYTTYNFFEPMGIEGGYNSPIFGEHYRAAIGGVPTHRREMIEMLPRRTLMGPGPSDVYPEVLAAMARPTIGHLDPAFVGFMDELNELLRYSLQTENIVTLPISAPGSAGMECCFVNMLEPGEKVVIASNGVFGGRMLENARRCGAVPVMVEFEWGTPVDPGKVEEALKANPDAWRWPLSIPRPLPVCVQMPSPCVNWPGRIIA